MPGLLIHDGYTLDGTLPASGPFPEIRFRYRMALPEEVQEWRRGLNNGSVKEELGASVTLLEKHLVSWDLKETAKTLRLVLGVKAMEQHADATDDELLPVPVQRATLRLLPHPIFTKLLDMVTGYGPKQEADLKNS